jgi:hypothetical protein
VCRNSAVRGSNGLEEMCFSPAIAEAGRQLGDKSA